MTRSRLIIRTSPCCALSGQPADAVLLYSAKAAQALQAQTSRPTQRRLFEKAWFFALSARIAAALDVSRRETPRLPNGPMRKRCWYFCGAALSRVITPPLFTAW